ncbi:MAG: ABC transporter ATP-binding protein [Planctomycetota bacterium]|nr:ABC transporter ATP-binding protein [Planctomycetota bacterium]
MLLGQNLTVTRGSRAILNNVSLSICPTEFVVVLGPSGSGKSTLMKTLSGIMKADQGEVTLDQQNLKTMTDRELCQHIGVVPQDDIIHRHLKVEAALNYAARLRFPPSTDPATIKTAVDRVLKLMELEDRRNVRIKRLSGGQRKRVNVGVELLDSPRFLFLDEPTSGLDPALEESMMRLFQSLARKGHGVLASTHSMASLDLADLLLVVMDGYLIYFAPPSRAAAHFQVKHYSEIFKAIRTASAADWARRFSSSPLSATITQKRVTAKKATNVNDALLNMQRATGIKVDTNPAPPSKAPPAQTASAKANKPVGSVDDLLASLAAELEEEKD